MTERVRFAALSRGNGNDREADGPDPTPAPETDSSPLEEMNAAEDAEQGLATRGRRKRPARMRVRRKP